MATDFFDRQDDARRRTGWLVVYFVIAVILIIATVYAAYTAILVGGQSAAEGGPRPAIFDPIRLAGVGTITGLVILLGSLFKTLSLREGGAAVARSLGGRLLDGETRDPAERRLLNIVEEMAIASGMPVPPVYVMDGESSINAFAAGHSPGDAVIGVTRGSLDHLDRDQLQGVIAHEFSHILNGDVRLDLRLVGILHGILLLALIGQILMRMTQYSSGSRRDSDGEKKDNSAAFFFMGLALYAIGYVGVFFGRLIKSAVSRQREFLADASAVQFTRNPEGLAGALKKIGGLAQGGTIRSPEAEEASHMFFGSAVSTVATLLSTHPPLEERIRFLDPQFDGTFPVVEEDEVVAATGPSPKPSRDTSGIGGLGKVLPGIRVPGGLGGSVLLPAAGAVEAVGRPLPQHIDYAAGLLADLPEPVASAAREPFGAAALVCALLLDPAEEVRDAQLSGLAEHAARGIAEEAARLAPMVASLGPQARVPLVDLALPALRRLSDDQYVRFRSNIDPLIRADGEVSLFEFALQHMLLRHLDRFFLRGPRPSARFESLSPLRDHAASLVSSLAWIGQEEPSAVQRAFAAGAAAFGPDGAGTALKSRKDSTLAGVDAALDAMATASPSVKKQVLQACAAAISADGQVTLAEAELLRAIADSLDCPMPPLLAG